MWLSVGVEYGWVSEREREISLQHLLMFIIIVIINHLNLILTNINKCYIIIVHVIEYS